jgi:hypothetical protein
MVVMPMPSPRKKITFFAVANCESEAVAVLLAPSLPQADRPRARRHAAVIALIFMKDLPLKKPQA